jgi:hypothetical protein
VWNDLVLVYLKEKFENKKLNTSDSKHNIPTYMFALSKPADLNYLAQGIQLYWAYPFSKGY